jgi:hypothetical protein
MQLNATQTTQPTKPADVETWGEKVAPWAVVALIAYIIFKGGRYGA